MYKLLVLICLIGIAPSALAHSPANTFTLSGTLSNVKSDRIVLWFMDADNVAHSDTVDLKNGHFSISGTVNRACEARLWTNLKNTDFDDSSIINFLIEPGNITISFNGNNPSAIQVAGSPLAVERLRWDSSKANLLQERENIYLALIKTGKLPESAAKIKQLQKLGDRRKIILGKIKSLDINYVRANTSSLLSASLLSKYAAELPVDSVQLYYTNFSREVQESRLGHNVLKTLFALTDDNEFRALNSMIDTAKSKQFLSLQSFYDLPLKDSAGNSVNLSELKGKLLVVDFWTSWCKPCIAEIPFINKLSQDYKSKNVEFISINLDKNNASWKKALQRNHIEGLQLGDSDSFYSLAALYSKVLYVGRYLIVDQKGKIINYYAPHPSEPEMRKVIEKLLPDL